MRRAIGPRTVFILLDFSTNEILGPMSPDGGPAFDVVPEAWSGRFPAQCKWKQGPAMMLAANAGSRNLRAGHLKFEQIKDLLRVLFA